MRHDELIKVKAEELHQVVMPGSAHLDTYKQDGPTVEIYTRLAKRMLQFGAECYEKGYNQGADDEISAEHGPESFFAQSIDQHKASLGLIEGK